MKGLPTLIRVHQWKLEEMRRILGELEGLRADLEQRLRDLHTQQIEEQRMAASFPEFGFTYSGYANSFIYRRDKLHQSIAEVEEGSRCVLHPGHRSVPNSRISGWSFL